MDAGATGPTDRAVPVAFVPSLEAADELVAEVAEGSELRVDEQVALLEALRRVQAEELDPVGCRRALVESAVEVLHADLGWLSLVDPDGEGFAVVHTVGVDDRIDIRRQSLSGFGAQAARRQATLIVNDFERSTRTPHASRAQLIQAGLRSLICTPLIAGELIGLLCIGRRGPERFERRDSVLLGTLAAQGAMTIHNGAMFVEVERQTQRMQAALSINTRVHDSLTAGDGLAGAASVLAAALRRAVSIQQGVVAEEPGWYAPDGHRLTRPDTADHVQADLVAAGEVLGAILVDGGEPLGELHGQTVEVVSTAIVSELLVRRRTEEAEWRLHGELLAELVSAPAPLARPLAIRAGRRGVDLAAPATVMVVARGRRKQGAASLLLEARAALRARLPRGAAVLAFDRGDSVVLALPAQAADGDVVAAVADALAATGRVRAGIGRATNHHDALRQADACLTLAAGPAHPDVVDVEGLGLLRAVLEVGPLHAAETVRRALGSVHAADQATRIPLLETLEAFCAAEGRVELAARLCHVHESTLRYRLDRLGEIIDLEGGPRRLLELRVAVEALRILCAAGRDPFAGVQSSAD
jgi:GAF domain/PucR C-terminal helix-turn-helix domain/GGDEF-like domain